MNSVLLLVWLYSLGPWSVSMRKPFRHIFNKGLKQQLLRGEKVVVDFSEMTVLFYCPGTVGVSLLTMTWRVECWLTGFSTG